MAPLQLTTLLAVIDGPRRRLQILRPRPWYLPHPRRRLPRVQGVIRVRRWGLPKPPMSVLRLSYDCPMGADTLAAAIRRVAGHHMHPHQSSSHRRQQLIGLEAAAAGGQEHFAPTSFRRNLVGEQDRGWA